MNIKLFTLFSITASLCLLCSCSNNTNTTNSESEINSTELSSITSENNSIETSTEIFSEFSESLEQVATHENAFDAEYETNLLVNNVWKCNSLNLIYRFSQDKIYYINNADDNTSTDYGTFYFTGTEGSPILVLCSEKNKGEETSYNIEFIDNENANLSSDSSGAEISFTISKFVATYSEETTENDSLSYNISYKQLSEDVYYPVLNGLDDEDFQNELNNKFLNDQKETLDSLESAYYSVSFKEKYCSENIISLFGNTYINYDGAAHPTNYFISYNIDLQQNKIITLSDIVDLKSISEDLFNNQNCLAEIDISTILDYNFFESSDDVYSYLKDNSTSFCFKDENTIEIYFSVSHADGDFTSVRVTEINF